MPRKKKYKVSQEETEKIVWVYTMKVEEVSVYYNKCLAEQYGSLMSTIRMTLYSALRDTYQEFLNISESEPEEEE